MRVIKRRRKDPNSGKTKVEKCYTAYFRPVGSDKEISRNTRCTQKENAELVAKRLLQEYEAKYSGNKEFLRNISKTKPIEEYLKKYLTHRKAELGENKQYQTIRRHLDRIITDCRWKTIRDISKESYLDWCSNLTIENKTKNHYLSSIKGFVNWLKDLEVIGDNNILLVKPFKVSKDPYRKALNTEECNRLLSVAGKRRIVYLFMMFTGLRRNELKQLKWSDIHFEAEGVSYVFVRSSTTKNSKNTHIPLHPQLKEELLIFKARLKRKHETVFNRIIPEVCTLKKDLEKAGIPFMDELGRRADLHSLRNTFNSRLLNEANAPERIRMEAMRHSDSSLTSIIYTDLNQLKTATYINQMTHLDWTEKWTDHSVLEGQKRSYTGKNDPIPTKSKKFDFTQNIDDQRLREKRMQ